MPQLDSVLLIHARRFDELHRESMRAEDALRSHRTPSKAWVEAVISVVESVSQQSKHLAGAELASIPGISTIALKESIALVEKCVLETKNSLVTLFPCSKSNLNKCSNIRLKLRFLSSSLSDLSNLLSTQTNLPSSRQNSRGFLTESSERDSTDFRWPHYIS